MSENKGVSNCIDCGNRLETYELNLKKQFKVMKCTKCELFHIFSKELFGGWELQRATKDSTHLPT